MAEHNIRVEIKDKVPQFKTKNFLALDKAIFTMALNIERLSKMQVPHRKGTLQNTGNTKREGPLRAVIEYGKAPPADAPYARRWEFEQANFREGRKSRYLRDPAELITKDAQDYFKQAFDSIRL